MSGIAAALGHKIGPMPAGAWAALVAGGLGIAYYTRTHAAATPAVDPGTADLDNTQLGTVPLASSSGAQSSGTITTNDEWSTKAITYLISQGATGTAADGAVRNYLSGNTLTASQTALIDLVLAAIGPPPTSPPMPESGVVGDASHPAGGSGGTSTQPGVPTALPAVVTRLGDLVTQWQNVGMNNSEQLNTIQYAAPRDTGDGGQTFFVAYGTGGASGAAADTRAKMAQLQSSGATRDSISGKTMAQLQAELSSELTDAGMGL